MKNYLRKSLSGAGIFLLCLNFVGCQTSTNHDWKRVEFISEPERATVFINGKNCGLTPHSELLSRSGSYDVRFSIPGYFDGTCSLVSYINDEGRPDISNRIELALEKITPEALAEREMTLAPKPAPATEKKEGASEKGTGASPAAVEFAQRPTPTDFTDFRLQEKALRRLLKNGSITHEEYCTLHEKLYEAYNENRLLKAPRLGTYESAL